MVVITEPGASIQIRIKYSDSLLLRGMELYDKEPWNEIVSRVLQENKKSKEPKPVSAT
jgi:hypothetical protein